METEISYAGGYFLCGLLLWEEFLPSTTWESRELLWWIGVVCANGVVSHLITYSSTVQSLRSYGG